MIVKLTSFFQNAKGDKYNAAVKWKIPVVKPSWLFDSVKEGVAKDEEDYHLGEHIMYFFKKNN